MMPFINGLMLALSSSPAASIVAKVTVISALGLTGAWLARGSRASVRHALLTASFGATLALPIASLVAPTVHLAVPIAVPNIVSDVVEHQTVRPSPIGADPTPLDTPSESGMGAIPAVPQASRLSLPLLLMTVWVAGAALALLPMVIGLWQIRSFRRCSLPWLHGHSVVEGLARDAGIHRRVDVLLHEGLPGPMTCGVVHPAIVVPPDAETWDAEDLNRVMVHELEHVRRADRVSQCFARALCAVYWFHPLVWIAWRRLSLEAERSCDDAVLGRSEATAYADQLVGLARRISISTKPPLLAMAARVDLATRVSAMLDSRQRRGRAGILSVALASAAAVVLVIAMSPLMLVAAPQSATTAPQTQTVTEPVTLAPAPVQKTAPVLIAQVQTPPRQVKTTQPPTGSVGLAGDWAGVLNLPNTSLTTVLHITGPDSDLKATNDSPSQRMFGVPVPSIVLSGSTLEFAIPFIDVKFKGDVLPNGTIAGTLTQRGTGFPLVLARTLIPPPVAPDPLQLGGVLNNGHYHHNLTGVEFDLPSGWSVGTTWPRDGNPREMTVLEDPDPGPGRKTIFCSVDMMPADTPPADIARALTRAVPMLLARRAGLTGQTAPHLVANYKIREGSVEQTLIGGLQAVRAIGEYQVKGAPIAELLTWVYSQHTHVFFFAKMPAANLPDVQPIFTQLVQSARIP
jgi:beta-lactamase regulating signal transducer with metallopeptidase domain